MLYSVLFVAVVLSLVLYIWMRVKTYSKQNRVTFKLMFKRRMILILTLSAFEAFYFAIFIECSSTEESLAQYSLNNTYNELQFINKLSMLFQLYTIAMGILLAVICFLEPMLLDGIIHMIRKTKNVLTCNKISGFHHKIFNTKAILNYIRYETSTLFLQSELNSMVVQAV